VIVATIAIIVSLPILACTLLAIRRAAVPESGLRYSKFLGLCEFCARVFLGLMFLSGGLSKLMPFPGVMGPVWLEESLIPYGLGFYARFIAWSEATIGLMLLTRLTAVLGSIMLVPLLVNILMVTISMNWRGTPWIIMIFLCMNLYLLAYSFDRWKSIICNATDERASVAETHSVLVPLLSMTLFLLAAAVHPLIGGFAFALVFVGVVGLFWSEIRDYLSARKSGAL
jgi:hypothetical protein